MEIVLVVLGITFVVIVVALYRQGKLKEVKDTIVAEVTDEVTDIKSKFGK